MTSERDTRNHAQRRKAESVKAIRERLAQYGHHDQAIDILEKIQDVSGLKEAENADLESGEIFRLKTALDGHIKMMNHYMPKVQEIVTPPETGAIKIEYVVPNADNPNNTST